MFRRDKIDPDILLNATTDELREKDLQWSDENSASITAFAEKRAKYFAAKLKAMGW